MFSFLKSERLGTECVRGFSNLRLPETELLALTNDLGIDATVVRGVEERLLLDKSFLDCMFLIELSPKKVSLKGTSCPK